VQIHVCLSKAVPELADSLVGCLLIRQRNRVGIEQGKAVASDFDFYSGDFS